MLQPITTTTFEGVVTGPMGCTYISKTVMVQEPDPPAVSNDTAICPGENARLWVDGTENLWTPGTTLSDSTAADPVAMPLTTTTYFVTTYDDTVCGPYTNSVTVAVFAGPLVDAGIDTIIAKGSSVQLGGLASGSSYSWSPATWLSCTNCLNPTANPTETITYYLTTTDADGCTSIDSVTVTVIVVPLNFVVPNAFSPNGDGINDLIFPIVFGRYSQMYFRVYNRWGEMLFEAVDGQSGWDGTHQGTSQPIGTYTYVVWGIDLEDSNHAVQSGSIHLLR
jgi:gliding motility-associated-like protein